MAIVVWVTAVWVAAFVLNGVYVAASAVESGVCAAVAVVSCVLDSDVRVAAASVLESGVGWSLLMRAMCRRATSR
jgi:hypothetical protein